MSNDDDLDLSALIGGELDVSALTEGLDMDMDDGLDLDALTGVPAPELPDPLADIDYTEDLETDARAEWDAIKASYQKQDKQQKAQFAGLYDSRFYFSEVYQTAEECERAMKIQARILGFDYKKAGFGYYREGRQVMKRMRLIAERLGIDISDL
ncbi:hypothetical protein CQ010_01485 [Arthrobacter sp. MYb211]|uniref:hypothetical protein n=1 Tax=unclassified Arthrobacter TaxID=235627 RepID=UPI000CFCFBF4|nr:MULTISPECIES: hypothetical protein [unclassified Arthrobacter]PRA13347.1 hypothetical protein CQ015_03740 [Arthrobacter sp. MYb221]PRC10544.1 hypothetical protein CQ010_01485 [Arthrobacter sp. MYb211]